MHLGVRESMTVVPVTSPDLDASEGQLVRGAVFGRLRISGRAGRAAAVKLGALLDDRAAGRGAWVPQHPVPVQSYQVGQDTLSFVAGCAPITDRINFLAAIRCGEMQPVMLARTVATLDHMLQGAADAERDLVGFPGRGGRQRLSLQAQPRGGGDPAPGLDARSHRI
jgi:alkanesulfonate monooxygenase